MWIMSTSSWRHYPSIIAHQGAHFALCLLVPAAHLQRRGASWRTCASKSVKRLCISSSLAYTFIWQGRAEKHIFDFEERHKDTFKASILRPGVFFPSSKYPKDAPYQRSAVERGINTLFGGVIRAAAGLTTEELGAFAVGAVKGKWDKQPAVYENGEMKRLVRS